MPELGEVMGMDPSVKALLNLSAVGIYFHAIFVSITLGFPLVIAALLAMYARTGDRLYFNAARVATMVLVVNFAAGAITGTLVEFGLVQIWPGSILAIATSALTPLALELIAFIMEIALLILFVVTLGRISVRGSLIVLFAYWAFALYSGLLITGVNSWLLAPWGVGPLAKALYPFMPEYGGLAFDAEKLVAVKTLLLATGAKLQEVIQTPEVAQKIGLLINDAYVAFKSPYAWASIAHNLVAAILVGSSIALTAWAYRLYKTGDERYVRILAAIILPFAILMVIQPVVLGHFMGQAVAHYNPTKFAMMEGARETYTNPLIGLLAFNDPNHPIYGFDHFRQQCNALGGTKLADVATAVGLTKDELLALASELNVKISEADLDRVLATEVRELCLRDVERAEALVTRINIIYYSKIAAGALALVATLILLGSLRETPLLTRIARVFEGILGGRRLAIFILALVVAIGVIWASAAGWYVREVGRKPWTVYGLLYPEELVTVVDYASSTGFLLFAYTVILSVNLGSLAVMALVASRAEYISETLEKALRMLRGEGG